MILSGYSSRIFEMSSVPMPEPVPPPSECVIWNPEKGKSYLKFLVVVEVRINDSGNSGRYPIVIDVVL